jgi:hypothetical protein
MGFESRLIIIPETAFQVSRRLIVVRAGSAALGLAPAERLPDRAIDISVIHDYPR